MESIHICRNHWDKHTEHRLLVEKGLTLRLVLGAILSVVALLTVYFWIYGTFETPC